MNAVTAAHLGAAVDHVLVELIRIAGLGLAAQRLYGLLLLVEVTVEGRKR